MAGLRHALRDQRGQVLVLGMLLEIVGFLAWIELRRRHPRGVRVPGVDRLLEDTGIDLCFDTGHHAFWDQDALAYFAKVRDRVAYVHLKNVDPKVRQRVLDGELSVERSYGEGVMCPLSEGAVNIPQVITFMRETTAGWTSLGISKPERK